MRFIYKFLLCCFLGTLSASQHELAVTAIFQNEAPYLREWIEYHKLVGVEHFYLYNHFSTDDFQKILEPYVKDKTVELINLDDSYRGRVRSIQPRVYSDTIQKLQGTVKWLAIIDIDEFLLPMMEKDVPTTLNKHFASTSLVYVNWRNFGTSKKTLSNNTLMIPNLTSCSLKSHPRNAVGKSIVKLDDVNLNKQPTPHFPILLQNKIVRYGDGTLFGKDGKPFNVIPDLRTDGRHHDKYIRINHYFTRDEGFWQNVKIPRIIDRKECIGMYKEQYHAFLLCKDTKILQFLRKFHPTFLKKLYSAKK